MQYINQYALLSFTNTTNPRLYPCKRGKSVLSCTSEGVSLKMSVPLSQAKIVKVQDTTNPDDLRLLDGPVEALKAGEAVGLPTETVYGLAANCLSPFGIRKIFKIKNRPMDNPLICHIPHGRCWRCLNGSGVEGN